MFEDLEKTIDLVNAPKKAPNFLLALVLCCYTEYWGRLVLGIPVGRSKKCFNEFFDRLGKCYQKCNQIHSKVTGIRRAMDLTGEKLERTISQRMRLLTRSSSL